MKRSTGYMVACIGYAAVGLYSGYLSLDLHGDELIRRLFGAAVFVIFSAASWAVSAIIR